MNPREGSNTCKNKNEAFRRAGFVQGADQPQDDHRVDGQHVTHMLVQVEVLQQEPGTQGGGICLPVDR